MIVRSYPVRMTPRSGLNCHVYQMQHAVLCDLLKDVDVSLCTHVLEYLGPHGDTHLTKMRLLEKEHIGTRLANAATNRKRKFILHDSLMVWGLEQIKLPTHLQLFFERFGINADAH